MPSSYAITVIVMAVLTLLCLAILETYHVNNVDVTVTYDRGNNRDPLSRPEAGDLFIRYKEMFGFTHFRCVDPATGDDGRIQGEVRELHAKTAGHYKEYTVVLWPHEWQAWAKQAECVFVANREPEDAPTPLTHEE